MSISPRPRPRPRDKTRRIGSGLEWSVAYSISRDAPLAKDPELHSAPSRRYLVPGTELRISVGYNKDKQYNSDSATRS